MNSEVTTKSNTSKTVPVRSDLPKGVHARFKRYFRTMPRTKKQPEIIAELIDLGLKSINF